MSKPVSPNIISTDDAARARARARVILGNQAAQATLEEIRDSALDLVQSVRAHAAQTDPSSLAREDHWIGRLHATLVASIDHAQREIDAHLNATGTDHPLRTAGPSRFSDLVEVVLAEFGFSRRAISHWRHLHKV